MENFEWTPLVATVLNVLLAMGLAQAIKLARPTFPPWVLALLSAGVGGPLIGYGLMMLSSVVNTAVGCTVDPLPMGCPVDFAPIGGALLGGMLAGAAAPFSYQVVGKPMGLRSRAAIRGRR